MSRLLLFTALAVTAFSSCSVSRSGQTKTPDDVYYSPARDGAAYVETEKKRDGYRSEEYSNSSDDRWLRMRVRDRYRWSAFDDYDWNDYRYSSWNMGAYGYAGYNPFYYNNFNSYFNSYYAWNSYYNPYCPGIIIVNPKGNVPVYTAVRNFNLSRYTNNNYNNTNRPLSTSKTGLRYSSSPGYNNTNTRTNTSLGSSIRKVFSNENSSGRNTYYSPGSNDRPTRTYTPTDNSSSRSYTPSSSSSSSSSSGSSGGSSGGGGGVSRPSRGGN